MQAAGKHFDGIHPYFSIGLHHNMNMMRLIPAIRCSVFRTSVETRAYSHPIRRSNLSWASTASHQADGDMAETGVVDPDALEEEAGLYRPKGGYSASAVEEEVDDQPAEEGGLYDRRYVPEVKKEHGHASLCKRALSCAKSNPVLLRQALIAHRRYRRRRSRRDDVPMLESEGA